MASGQFTVAARKFHELAVHGGPGSTVAWQWRVVKHDVSFVVRIIPLAADGVTPGGPELETGHQTRAIEGSGTYQLESQSQVILMWSNMYSWVNPKEVMYEIRLLPQEPHPAKAEAADDVSFARNASDEDFSERPVATKRGRHDDQEPPSTPISSDDEETDVEEVTSQATPARRHVVQSTSTTPTPTMTPKGPKRARQAAPSPVKMCFVCSDECADSCALCEQSVHSYCVANPKHQRACKPVHQFQCPPVQLCGGLDFVRAPPEFPLPTTEHMASDAALFGFLGPVFMDCVRARLPPTTAIKDLLATWRSADESWIIRIEAEQAHEKWGCGRSPSGFFTFRATAVDRLLQSQMRVTVTPLNAVDLPRTEQWAFEAGVCSLPGNIQLSPIKDDLQAGGLSVALYGQVTNWDILLELLRASCEPWMQMQITSWWAKQDGNVPLPFIFHNRNDPRCQVLLAEHLVMSRLDRQPLVVVAAAAPSSHRAALELCDANFSIRFVPQAGDFVQLIVGDAWNIAFCSSGVGSAAFQVACQFASYIIIVASSADTQTANLPLLTTSAAKLWCNHDRPSTRVPVGWRCIDNSHWQLQLAASVCVDWNESMRWVQGVGSSIAAFHQEPVEVYFAMKQQLQQVTLTVEDHLSEDRRQAMLRIAAGDQLWQILSQPRFGVQLPSMLWQPAYNSVLLSLPEVYCSRPTEACFLLSVIQQAAAASSGDSNQAGYGAVPGSHNAEIGQAVQLLQPHPLMRFYVQQINASPSRANAVLSLLETCLRQWEAPCMQILSARRRLLADQQDTNKLTPLITAENVNAYAALLLRAAPAAIEQLRLVGDEELADVLMMLQQVVARPCPDQISAAQTMALWCPVRVEESQQAKLDDAAQKRKAVEDIDGRRGKLQVTPNHLNRELFHWGRRVGQHDFERAAAAVAVGIAQCAQSFEVIDGDSLKFNDVLVRSIIGDQRVIVVSLVGVQSAGKSTSANHIFHLDCATSVGMCTRGVYGAVVPLEEPIGDATALLVLDVEGVSGAGGSDIRSKRLLQFVVAASDIMLVVTKTNVDANAQSLLELAAMELRALQLNNDHRLALGFLFAQAPERVVRAAYDFPPYSEHDKSEANALGDDVAAAVDSFSGMSKQSVVIRRRPLLLASKSSSDAELYLRGCRLVRQAIRSMCSAHEIPSTSGKSWVDRYHPMWRDCIALMIGYSNVRNMEELNMTRALTTIGKLAYESLSQQHIEPLAQHIEALARGSEPLKSRVSQIMRLEATIADARQRLLTDGADAAATSNGVQRALELAMIRSNFTPSSKSSAGPMHNAVVQMRAMLNSRFDWVESQRRMWHDRLVSDADLEDMEADAVRLLRDLAMEGVEWLQNPQQFVDRYLQRRAQAVGEAALRFMQPMEDASHYVSSIAPLQADRSVESARASWKFLLNHADEEAGKVSDAKLVEKFNSHISDPALVTILASLIRAIGKVLKAAQTANGDEAPESWQALVDRGKSVFADLQQCIDKYRDGAEAGAGLGRKLIGLLKNVLRASSHSLSTALAALDLWAPWWVYFAVRTRLESVVEGWRASQLAPFESRLRALVAQASASFDACKSSRDVARTFVAMVCKKTLDDVWNRVTADFPTNLTSVMPPREELNLRFQKEVLLAEGDDAERARHFILRIKERSVRSWWREKDFEPRWHTQVQTSLAVAQQRMMDQVQSAVIRPCVLANSELEAGSGAPSELQSALERLLITLDPVGAMSRNATKALQAQDANKVHVRQVLKHFVAAMQECAEAVLKQIPSLFEPSEHAEAQQCLLDVSSALVTVNRAEFGRSRESCENQVWSDARVCNEVCPYCTQLCNQMNAAADHEHECDCHLWSAFRGWRCSVSGAAKLTMCTDKQNWDCRHGLDQGGSRKYVDYVTHKSISAPKWRIEPADATDHAVFQALSRMWPLVADELCEHFKYRDPLRIHDDSHTRKWWQWASVSWPLCDSVASIRQQIVAGGEAALVLPDVSALMDALQSGGKMWSVLTGLIGEDLEAWWQQTSQVDDISSYYLHSVRVNSRSSEWQFPARLRATNPANLDRLSMLRIRLIVLGQFIRSDSCLDACKDVFVDEFRITLLAIYAWSMRQDMTDLELLAFEHAASKQGIMLPCGSHGSAGWIGIWLHSQKEAIVAIYNAGEKLATLHNKPAGSEQLYEPAVYSFTHTKRLRDAIGMWLQTPSSSEPTEPVVYQRLVDQQWGTRTSDRSKYPWLHQEAVFDVGSNVYSAWVSASRARISSRWGLNVQWETLQDYEASLLRTRLGIVHSAGGAAHAGPRLKHGK